MEHILHLAEEAQKIRLGPNEHKRELNTVDLHKIIPSIATGSKSKFNESVTTDQKDPEKRECYQEVRGVKWFYYLNANRDKSGQPVESLFSFNKEAENQFVVCFNMPKLNNKVGKLFAAFPTMLDFLDWIRLLPMDRWHFFEVILGTKPQKIYFDIDISKDMMDDFPKERISGVIDRFFNSLIGRIREMFFKRGLPFDLTKNVMIFHSNTIESINEKQSYHIILDGYYVENSLANKEFIKELLEDFPDEFKRFLDPSMYSKIQQLRFFLSRKVNTERIKLLMEEWNYGPNIIKWYLPPIRATTLEEESWKKTVIIFTKSCVMNIDGCEILKMNVPELKSTMFKSTKSLEDEFELSEEMVKAISERVDQTLFKIYSIHEVNGTLILLRRNMAAGCSLCNRVHENENAFLSVAHTGDVYFYCRRNPEKKKKVATIYDLLPDFIKEEDKDVLYQMVLNEYNKTNQADQIKIEKTNVNVNETVVLSNLKMPTVILPEKKTQPINLPKSLFDLGIPVVINPKLKLPGPPNIIHQDLRSKAKEPNPDLFKRRELVKLTSFS